MDFSFHEAQTAVRDLAKRVFVRVPAGPAHVREVWRELGRAQLLGVALPEHAGGSDAGIVSLCLLVEQAGRAANLVPLVPALVLGGLPLSQLAAASPSLAERLSAVCSGGSIVCGSYGAHGETALRVRKQGPDYLLSGTASCVEALPLADAVVVAARDEHAARMLFLLDPYARGVTIHAQSVASGCSLGTLQLSEVRLGAGALLFEGDHAERVITQTLDSAYLVQCAYDLGLCEAALELTARYAAERQQFGRAIGTFQAVTQRIADMHIAVETIRLTLWRAAWLAEHGEPAGQAIAVARSIATQASHQVLCAAQHIHGGMGFARDYPLHRYFLASKQNELHLGGPAYHLARLGKMLAQ